MKTMIYIIAICLLVLMAVPVITPDESKSNSAFAEFGPCPSCWVWKCGDDICIRICTEETSENGFYFHYGYWTFDYFIWDPPTLFYNECDTYAYTLMLTGGLYTCLYPCHEWTTVLHLPEPEDWIPNVWGDEWVCNHPDGWPSNKPLWAVTFGDYFDPYNPVNWLCTGNAADLHDEGPDW